MNSVLALSNRERAELFSATAQKLGFSNEAIAEKDFWVCWTLGQLFQGIPGIGDHLVFKGGTSLSKVYRAVNRFSEDVDITVGRELLGFDSDEHDPEKAANKSQAKKKIEELAAACGRWVAGDFKTQLESRTLERDYERMRREMYYGPSLEWAEILEKLQILKSEIDRSG